MTACTDDERRRVAEAFRRYGKETTNRGFASLFDVFDACGLSYYDGAVLYDRLADLIEPSDHIGDPNKMVDREALLALADELDKDGRLQRERQKSGKRWFIDGLDVREYARRIREALGVEC